MVLESKKRSDYSQPSVFSYATIISDCGNVWMRRDSHSKQRRESAGRSGSSAVLFVALCTAALAQPLRPSEAEPALPRAGSYEIIARLELPHVERWAIDHVATVCLSRAAGGLDIPVPVVSANNPFAKCAAVNFLSDGATLQYDIVCPDRGSARAHATYTVLPDSFSGRVAMVMGAKNMTMTEVQHARRTGDCGSSVRAFATGF